MADALPDVYMRFEGITGECQDAAFRGTDGWFTVTNFNFGFGWGGATSGDSGSAGAGQKGTAGRAPATSPKPTPPGRKEGTLTPQPFRFSKNADAASQPLLEQCHAGKPIQRVEVVACRPSGADREQKIPFLRFILETVTLKKYSITIGENALPSESLEFSFGKFTVETIWTSNSTGEREYSQPRNATWDFDKTKEEAGTSSG